MCLKALFDTLYGPAAALAVPMTRERLRALFIGMFRSRDWSRVVILEPDEQGVVDPPFIFRSAPGGRARDDDLALAQRQVSAVEQAAGEEPRERSRVALSRS